MFLRRTLCIFLLCLTAGELSAERRALVIGNAAYASLDPLQNTLTDAKGYATAFGALGFDVTFLTDLDEAAMVDNVVSFVDGIAPGDEVAFVYAGHGWSADGINYLIPTDAPKSGSARQLSRRSLPLKNGVNGVLDDIAAQGASLSLAIIDACRDNPFAGNGTRSIGATRGLARLDPQQGSFVIYSAGEGQTALDRLALDGPEQKYSVFTRHFLPLLTSPMYLEDAVFAAQERTARAARSQDHTQIPAVYRQKLGKTCLVETCEAAPEPVARPRPAAGPRKDWVYQIAFPRGTKGHIGFIAVHPERDEVAVLTSEYPEASEADPDAHSRDIRYFSGDGALMWQVEVANRTQVLAFEGDDLLVLGSNGIQWMDRATGRVSKVKNYAGRREVDLSSLARIGASRLRVFGDLRRGSVTTEDVVFDIDVAQARLSEPVFRSEENLNGWSVRLAPDGHFIAEVPVAAAEPPDRPSANDGLHAPDGTILRHVAIGDTPWTDWDISSQGYVSLSQV